MTKHHSGSSGSMILAVTLIAVFALTISVQAVELQVGGTDREIVIDGNGYGAGGNNYGVNGDGILAEKSVEGELTEAGSFYMTDCGTDELTMDGLSVEVDARKVKVSGRLTGDGYVYAYAGVLAEAAFIKDEFTEDTTGVRVNARVVSDVDAEADGGRATAYAYAKGDATASGELDDVGSVDATAAGTTTAKASACGDYATTDSRGEIYGYGWLDSEEVDSDGLLRTTGVGSEIFSGSRAESGDGSTASASASATGAATGNAANEPEETSPFEAPAEPTFQVTTQVSGTAGSKAATRNDGEIISSSILESTGVGLEDLPVDGDSVGPFADFESSISAETTAEGGEGFIGNGRACATGRSEATFVSGEDAFVSVSTSGGVVASITQKGEGETGAITDVSAIALGPRVLADTIFSGGFDMVDTSSIISNAYAVGDWDGYRGSASTSCTRTCTAESDGYFTAEVAYGDVTGDSSTMAEGRTKAGASASDAAMSDGLSAIASVNLIEPDVELGIEEEEEFSIEVLAYSGTLDGSLIVSNAFAMGDSAKSQAEARGTTASDGLYIFNDYIFGSTITTSTSETSAEGRTKDCAATSRDGALADSASMIGSVSAGDGRVAVSYSIELGMDDYEDFTGEFDIEEIIPLEQRKGSLYATGNLDASFVASGSLAWDEEGNTATAQGMADGETTADSLLTYDCDDESRSLFSETDASARIDTRTTASEGVGLSVGVVGSGNVVGGVSMDEFDSEVVADSSTIAAIAYGNGFDDGNKQRVTSSVSIRRPDTSTAGTYYVYNDLDEEIEVNLESEASASAKSVTSKVTVRDENFAAAAAGAEAVQVAESQTKGELESSWAWGGFGAGALAPDDAKVTAEAKIDDADLYARADTYLTPTFAEVEVSGDASAKLKPSCEYGRGRIAGHAAADSGPAPGSGVLFDDDYAADTGVPWNYAYGYQFAEAWGGIVV